VATDFLLALALLVLAAPAVLVMALLVKLTSRGPVFFSQVRLGQDGRTYTLYKIRTMVADSEKDGPCWSLPGDPRVTRLGQFLRVTHLDELPQLFNVLRGEMSLVGPRPEQPALAPPLERALPRYRERLLARPGLTGIAQVQLPADTDVESVRNKLVLDLHYVYNADLWLDLRVIVATPLMLVGVPPRVLTALFRLPRPEALSPASRRAGAADAHALPPPHRGQEERECQVVPALILDPSQSA
jgi:lipopolysaccharide/colanic/teichoic acid biosynthesis glycosyltransferase